MAASRATWSGGFVGTRFVEIENVHMPVLAKRQRVIDPVNLRLFFSEKSILRVTSSYEWDAAVFWQYTGERRRGKTMLFKNKIATNLSGLRLN